MTAPLLHSPADAAALLGVTPRWLKEQVAARTIPHHRLSPRVIRFSDADLAAIADRAAVIAVAPPRLPSVSA